MGGHAWQDVSRIVVAPRTGDSSFRADRTSVLAKLGWTGPPPIEWRGALIDGRKRVQAGLCGPSPYRPRSRREAAEALAAVGHLDRAVELAPHLEERLRYLAPEVPLRKPRVRRARARPTGEVLHSVLTLVPALRSGESVDIDRLEQVLAPWASNSRAKPEGPRRVVQPLREGTARARMTKRDLQRVLQAAASQRQTQSEFIRATLLRRLRELGI
jgi:hypothetical protein